MRKVDSVNRVSTGPINRIRGKVRRKKARLRVLLNSSRAKRLVLNITPMARMRTRKFFEGSQVRT